jgi:hypothetical protein
VHAGHANHEELVEVGGEDRQELAALDQRQRLVLGQLQDAVVEVQPGQLPVEVELGVGQPVDLFGCACVGHRYPLCSRRLNSIH